MAVEIKRTELSALDLRREAARATDAETPLPGPTTSSGGRPGMSVNCSPMRSATPSSKPQGIKPIDQIRSSSSPCDRETRPPVQAAVQTSRLGSLLSGAGQLDRLHARQLQPLTRPL